MRSSSLTTELQHVLDNAKRMREFFYSAYPVALMNALSIMKTEDLRKFLNALYGSEDSEERRDIKKYAEECADRLLDNTEGQSEEDENYHDKSVLYGIWSLACGLDEIDPARLANVAKYIKHNICDSQLTTGLEFLCDCIYGTSEDEFDDGWVLVEPGHVLPSAINNVCIELMKRKTIGAKSFFLNLSYADFGPSNIFISCGFNDARLRGASFVDCQICDSSFANADLEYANFSKASLEDVDLTLCKLKNTNFEKANLSRVTFFEDIDFSKMDSNILIFDRIAAFNQYKENKGFDELKEAILSDYLQKIAQLVDLNKQVRLLSSGLNSTFFGTHQSGSLENWNRFFANTQDSIGENKIFTESQRKIRKMLRVAQKEILRLEREKPVDLKSEPIMIGF